MVLGAFTMVSVSVHRGFCVGAKRLCLPDPPGLLLSCMCQLIGIARLYVYKYYTISGCNLSGTTRHLGGRGGGHLLLPEDRAADDLSSCHLTMPDLYHQIP